jgi:hypothetical protein
VVKGFIFSVLDELKEKGPAVAGPFLYLHCSSETEDL